MSVMKKILAVAVALILVLAVFAFPVNAETPDGTMTFSLNTSSDTYSAGDTVTVNIYISCDYNATCIRVPVLYSKEVFEVPASGISLTAYGTCLDRKNSLDYNTDVSSTPIDLYNVTDYYDGGTYGIVMIQWTASITSSTIYSFKSTESVRCFSFQLKVKEDASGEGTLIIPGQDELKLNAAFYDQAVIDPADAKTITRVNLTVNVDEWSITVEEGLRDGITAAPGSDVIIDYEEMIIKNWTPAVTETDVRNGVIPTGNATLNFKATNGWGTGVRIRVWSGDTQPIGDYYVLVYGDTDGDGDIASLDSSMVLSYVQGFGTDFDFEAGDIAGELKFKAGDVDQSGEVDSLDYSTLLGCVQGFGEIDQSM